MNLSLLFLSGFLAGASLGCAAVGFLYRRAAGGGGRVGIRRKEGWLTGRGRDFHQGDRLSRVSDRSRGRDGGRRGGRWRGGR